jgi:hypothetical protein
MALPKPVEARRYYRAAVQRFDDAQLLLEQSRTTGAVYLAGYTVECFEGVSHCERGASIASRNSCGVSRKPGA